MTFLADILAVGEAAERTSEVKEYVDSLKQRIARIRSVTSTVPAEQRPRVACIEWIDPLMIGANWMPGLVELAGGRNELTHDGRHSAYNQWSEVMAYDPEVIIVMPCGFDLERTVQESRPLARIDGIQNLTAVKTGRVFAVDGNAYFNRSGPRIVDSLEILAHLLHPELVQAPDAEKSDEASWCRLSLDAE